MKTFYQSDVRHTTASEAEKKYEDLLLDRHTTVSEAKKKYEDLLLDRHTTVSEANYYIQ